MYCRKVLLLPLGSGYRTINGSLNMKSYSTISCNMTVTYKENRMQQAL